MYRLTGNTPYEQVSSARGKLAGRLMKLIDKYGEDARVYQLAEEYVQWWYAPFDDRKDAAGRALWDMVDELMGILDGEYSRVGNRLSLVGRHIGRVVGITARATMRVKGSSMNNARKLLDAVRDGYRESWSSDSDHDSYHNCREADAENRDTTADSGEATMKGREADDGSGDTIGNGRYYTDDSVEATTKGHEADAKSRDTTADSGKGIKKGRKGISSSRSTNAETRRTTADSESANADHRDTNGNGSEANRMNHEDDTDNVPY